MSPITSSPGKYIWAASAGLFNIAKVPLLALYYLHNYTRPHPEWSVLQSIMNNLINAFIYHTALVEAVTPLDLTPGSLGDRFVTIPNAPDLLSTKIVTSDPKIVPQATGGIWFLAAFKWAPAKLDKPIVLHFHPGGYVMGDVRMDGAFAARLPTDRVGSYAFWNLYRLALNSSGQFPTALQDALASYRCLLKDLSLPSSQIILSGDSAGAHIVICMLRCLAEHGEEVELPAPRGALLFSPAITTRPRRTLKVLPRIETTEMTIWTRPLSHGVLAGCD